MRTTLIKKGQSWIMVGYCEKVSEMVEPDSFIEETPGRTLVLTFLTDGFQDVENMGFVVDGEEGRAMLEAIEILERGIQPMLDIPRHEQLEQQELELPPELPEGGELREGLALEEQLQLQVPQEGGIVVGEILPTEIEADSSLATLRAACGFYGVSRSGSKAKYFRKLCQHQKTLELLAAQAAIEWLRDIPTLRLW